MSYAERRDQKLTGWWYGEVEVKAGATDHRFRKRFKTKGEADGYEAYIRATGQEPPGSTDTPVGTFKEIAARFKDANPDWGRKDYSAVQRLEWICAQPIGALDIKQVTTAKLDDLVDRLRKLPVRGGGRMGNRTLNRYLDAAAKVLGFAHERGHIVGVPHIPRKENTGRDRTQVVNYDMEGAVVRWLEAQRDPRYAFFVQVFIESGFRRGELWKLTPAQITVTTEIDAETGEQYEAGWLELESEQTKTGAPRKVCVPADMATKLRAIVAANTLPTRWQVYGAFKRAVKACGGHKELTLHSLRHTRATRVIESGVDALIAKDLLGHKAIATTMKYVHLNNSTLAKAAKKVHQARGDTTRKGDVVEFALRKNSG